MVKIEMSRGEALELKEALSNGWQRPIVRELLRCLDVGIAAGPESEEVRDEKPEEAAPPERAKMVASEA